MSVDKLVDSTALESNLTLVANAIREKGGTSASLAFPSDFVTAIGNIQTDSTVEEKDVNFIDYDGTLLYSYTKEDALALTAMPDNPSHGGLIAQGWNYTLAEMKEECNSVGKCLIGQMYITTDGTTRIYVHLVENATSPYIMLCPNGNVTINWGDGYNSVLSGTSLTTVRNAQHTYNSPGDYVITLTVYGKCAIRGWDSYGSGLLRQTTSNSGSYYHKNFIYANSIKDIRVGSNIVIGDYAFYYLRCLNSISIPYGCDFISDGGSNAFSYSYTLRGFVLPSGITSIPNYCFAEMTLLERVSIPKSVTSIGNYAYCDDRAVKNLYIPSSVSTIGTYAFSGMWSLEQCSLPSGVASLSDSAFSFCQILQSIDIPTGVTSIGATAFAGCNNLPSIMVPNTVTSIGNQAFSPCGGLCECHFTSTTPPTFTGEPFNVDYSPLLKIYVPWSADHSVLNAYKTATNLTGFANIIYEEPLKTVIYSLSSSNMYTLVINEPGSDRQTNIAKYGSVIHEWDGWDGVNVTYNFNSEYGQPWYSYRDYIRRVIVAAPISPTSTAYWFAGLTSCTTFDLALLDTSNVVDMHNMFWECYTLYGIDLSSFDTANVADMSEMFYECTHLSVIIATSSFVTTSVELSDDMFWYCGYLIGGNGTHFDSSKTDATYARIDASGSPGYFTIDTAVNTAYYDYGDSALIINESIKDRPENLIKHGYDGEPPTVYPKFDSVNNPYVFEYTGYDPGDFSSGSWVTAPPWVDAMGGISSVIIGSAISPTSMAWWFYGAYSLSEIDFSLLDSSNVTDMQHLFDCAECFGENGRTIDLRCLDTSSVTNMAYMLAHMYSYAQTIDLSSFDTSNVTNMEGMFREDYCTETIIVSSDFVTTNVTSSSDMFLWCDMLVGGEGTDYYSIGVDDKTYACIDNPPSAPGYFTAAT